MSLDKNSAMLSRLGRLVDRYWMVGDSENYDSGPSPVIITLSGATSILYIEIVLLNDLRSALI
ncbi:MAG: hypothetical protein WCC92_11380 [Candidatus Korobacteraceae bacterium]